MSNNTKTISPRWSGFHRLWIIITVILFLLLLLFWFLGYGPKLPLLGYGPNGSKCTVPSTIVEKAVARQNKAPVIKMVEKLVIAPDTLAPRLGIKGSSTMHTLIRESFTDDGVIALDNIDSKVDVKITGKIDN